MEIAAIFGAGGGIGSAIANHLEKKGKFDHVLRSSSSQSADIACDICQEESIVAAAEKVAAMPANLTMCIVASGTLHSKESGPEKALSQLDPDWMMESYIVNAIAPAMIAKHFLPLMPRKRKFHFAAISARVGSISDNRLGGWHSYRASKAALNMLIRNLGIEYTRQNPSAVIAALHPGTVDTPLSKPFQGNVPAGKLFSSEYSAERMIDVLIGLEAADTGRIFAWDGDEIQP